MKRSRRSVLVTFAAACLLGSIASHAAQEARQPEARVPNPQRPLAVLFVGNSYTYYNDLACLVAELAKSDKYPMRVGRALAPGWTLEQHWNAQGNPKTPDSARALRLIWQGGWDIVVLQEQSTLGHPPNVYVNGKSQRPTGAIESAATFHRYARLFDVEIRKSGAKTMFLMTWARERLPAAQGTLTTAYEDIAKELHALLAPAGLAWQTARTRRPSLNLYQDEGGHPNPAGSYLTAAVVYASLTGRSPVGLSRHLVGKPVDLASGRILDEKEDVDLVNLSDDDAAFLQQVAWETVGQTSIQR